MKSICLAISFLVFTMTNLSPSYSHAGESTPAIYKATLKSADIGDVRFYIEISVAGNIIKGGSLQNNYANNFNLIDKTKIKLFGGLKDNRLVYIEGVLEKKEGESSFHTAFYSPLGSFYFDGVLKKNGFTGELTTKSGLYKGKISAELYGTPIVVMSDYKVISDTYCFNFEKFFFNPGFFKTSKYKHFKKKLDRYCNTSVDDLHYVFAMFYYIRSLPYSHIGIWRNASDPESSSTEEDIEYSSNGMAAILKIKSFDLKMGEIEKIFPTILNGSSKGLIIDLRDNPGGNIGPAIELGQYLSDTPLSGGYFLSREYYESKIGNTDPCFIFSSGGIDEFLNVIEKNKCTEIKIFPDKPTYSRPIYILTNGNTASACEPLVYALKQNKMITVVGAKTAGKMLSAVEKPLPDNFVIFIPNADYVTNDGKRLDQVGVEAQIKLNDGTDAQDYALKLINK